MPIDPIESEVGILELNENQNDDDEDNDMIRHCETSPAWTELRDKLADEIFTSWRLMSPKLIYF